MIMEAHEDHTVMQEVSMTPEDSLLVFAQEQESSMLANGILVCYNKGVRLNLTKNSTVMDIAAMIVDGLEGIDDWFEAAYWRRNFNVMGWL
jgi:hypothetical protein